MASTRPATRLTVGVDFHGVICAHPEGSQGLTQPDWPDVPGAIDWLASVSGRYDVHLVSARFNRPGREGGEAMAAVRRWLASRGIPLGWTAVGDSPPRIKLTPFKPACVVWVDDRAFAFRGEFPTLEEIGAFRPWNRP